MRVSPIVLIVIVGLLGIGASWAAGSLMVAGHHSAVQPARAPASDIVLTTADGVHIAATFNPGRRESSPAVMLLHGVGASRQSTASNAAWLATLGYATLTIDFRGHGQSDLAPRSFGLHEASDALAAFTWLKRRQHGAPVAVIGVSLGGAAALIGDRGPVSADALILQAVYPDIRHAIRNRIASRLGRPIAYALEPLLSFQSLPRFGVPPSRLSPLAALHRFGGPVFVIGGEQDRSTPATESRAMFDAAHGRRELWLVPVGDHPDICDMTGVTYRAKVRAFLAAAMPLPR